LLARTQEGFWGYRLEVRTPSASATVKGTAFSLAVDPQQDATTVKVLAGSLFFSPHLNGVGVNVGAGEMSWVQAQRLPRLPKPLAPADRKALLEAYRIGPDPLAALVIGGGPERVRELLQPPLIYLSMRDHPQLQFFLRKTINELNRAILERDDLALAETGRHLSVLEMALGDITDPELAVPLRLFAGAIAASRKEPERANRHFRWIVEKAPQHPLAPLALAAAGDFERLLARYPGSPEADLARQSLSHRIGRRPNR
ncbi:MAG: FecR domain-containing protein, partial [Candidatus Omnitrophica bacterium]|nr:FecR domain-containing protein [Candidatus Omnitrophota bacterium]